MTQPNDPRKVAAGGPASPGGAGGPASPGGAGGPARPVAVIVELIDHTSRIAGATRSR
jgi:hypothetical protein